METPQLRWRVPGNGELVTTLAELQPGDVFRLNNTYRDQQSRPAYASRLRNQPAFNFYSNLTVLQQRPSETLSTDPGCTVVSDEAGTLAMLHPQMRIRTD